MCAFKYFLMYGYLASCACVCYAQQAKVTRKSGARISEKLKLSHRKVN